PCPSSAVTATVVPSTKGPFCTPPARLTGPSSLVVVSAPVMSVEPSVDAVIDSSLELASLEPPSFELAPSPLQPNAKHVLATTRSHLRVVRGPRVGGGGRAREEASAPLERSPRACQ